jgi:hypothetical protein
MMQPFDGDWGWLAYKYHNICLTGGEIFMSIASVSTLNHALYELRKVHKFGGNIFLYTQTYHEHGYELMFKYKVNGFQYSLHSPLSKDEINSFEKAQNKVFFWKRYKQPFTTQLWLHPDLQSRLNIIPSIWNEIKKPERLLEDGEMCLPEEEDLFILRRD